MKDVRPWRKRLKAIALGVGLGFVFYNGGNWWKIAQDGMPPCAQEPVCYVDFLALYTGAKLFRERPAALYDADTQLAYENSVRPTEHLLPFVYPPITAAVLAPFGMVKFSSAFLLITLVNFWLILESLRRWIRFQPLSADQAHWLSLFSLCNFGVHAVLLQGQTSAFILLLLTIQFFAARDRRELQTGFWTGLLCVKPQFLLIPCLSLWLNRQRRALTAALVVTILLTLGGSMWIGFDATKNYLRVAQNFTFQTGWSNEPRAMHNWKAIAITWFPNSWQTQAQWLGNLGLIATVLIVNSKANRLPNGRELSWITNVVALLLVSPHLFTHDLTLLVIPCALFLSSFKSEVPPIAGISLIALGFLPALNYVLPTSTALTLLLLLLLSCGSILLKKH
jgi:hypothetical protein